jgi:hypothetical protein
MLRMGSMREGWNTDDYLILFDQDEISAASEKYSISTLLPGYEVVGLRGWDDFIVRNREGQIFTVPTIPVDAKYLASFQLPESSRELQTDERFLGKIKWYVKPPVFGGDPSQGENLIWVNHEQHAQLVRYWNDAYRSIAQPRA